MTTQEQMKECLQGYLLKKLKEMEDERERKGRVPKVILLKEYHGSIMEDMRAMLIELNDHGIVEMGPTLNEMYVRLNPENALEE